MTPSSEDVIRRTEQTGRPTENAGPKIEPPDWWEDFWQRHFRNTGQTREEAISMLNGLLGKGWVERPAEEIETRLRKARSWDRGSWI